MLPLDQSSATRDDQDQKLQRDHHDTQGRSPVVPLIRSIIDRRNTQEGESAARKAFLRSSSCSDLSCSMSLTDLYSAGVDDAGAPRSRIRTNRSTGMTITSPSPARPV